MILLLLRNLITKNTDGIHTSGNAFRINFNTSCDVTFNSTNNLITNFDSLNGVSFMRFKLGSNLSGSGLIFDNNDTITLGITASKSNFTTSTTTREYQIQITKNNAPSITTSNITDNLNTNLARNGANLVEFSFIDPEGDTINFNSFDVNFNNSNPTLLTSKTTSNKGYITAPTNNTASDGIYGYTASIEDIHGFRSSSFEGTFTIDASPLPEIQSGSDLFISKGSIINEYVLKSEALAKTGSNFTVSDNFASVFVSFSDIEGTPTSNVLYALGSGRDSSKFTLVEDNNQTASIKLISNLSGSSFASDNELHFSISASDAYGNISTTVPFTASLVDVVTPTVTLIANNTVLNTNEARPSTPILTTQFTSGTFNVDLESPFSHSFTGNGFTFIDSPNTFTLVDGSFTTQSSVNTNMSADTYEITASIVDDRGFSGSNDLSFVITQAGSGSLDTPSTLYIIESAQTDDPVVTVSAGTSSNASDYAFLTATYNNTDEGNPTAQTDGWFTGSSNHDSRINISPDGYLSASSAFALNPPSPSEQLNCLVHFTDQYGNIGTGSFNISVANNAGPTITITEQFNDLFNVVEATANTILLSGSISDPDNNVPYTASLAGTDASSFEISFANTNSSSFGIFPKTDLITARTYNFTISASDSTGLGGDNNTHLPVLISIEDAVNPTFTIGGVFICAGARSNEIFTTSTGNAQSSTIATRKINDPGGTTNAAQVICSNLSSLPGDTTITGYEILSGNDGAFIDITDAGYLFVKNEQNISGSFNSGDTISFTVRGTDSNNNTGDLSVTANVVAPNVFLLAAPYLNPGGTPLTLGGSLNPRGSNVAQSGSRIALFQNYLSLGTYRHSALPSSIDELIIVDNTDTNNNSISFNLTDIELTNLIEVDINFVPAIRADVNTKIDLISENPTPQYFDVYLKAKDARGFISSTSGLERIYIENSPTMSKINSGSDFFISEGAQANEFILTTQAAAKTGSRFSTNADSSSINVEYNSDPTNPLKDGTLTDVQFSFSGTHANYIRTGSSGNTSGSLILKIDLSGSSDASQDTLEFSIIASQSFGGLYVQREVFNNTITPVTVSIVDVVPPSASFTFPNPDILNSNQARPPLEILTTTITSGTFNVDLESPFSHSFTGTGFSFIDSPNNFVPVAGTSNKFSQTTQVNSNLAPGPYNLTASIVDNRGFNLATSSSFSIADANLLVSFIDTQFYVNIGARSNEYYYLTTDSAINFPLSLFDIARLKSNPSTQYGNPFPLTYTLLDGSGVSYITLEESAFSDAPIKVNNNISGSSLNVGDEIQFRAVVVDSFDNELTGSFTASVVDLAKPTITQNINSPNNTGHDTNQFEGNSLTLLQITSANTGSYPLDNTFISFSAGNTGTDISTRIISASNTWNTSSFPYTLQISGSGSGADLGGTQVSFKTTARNNRGFTGDAFETNFTIAQAPSGTLDTVDNAYIIESATPGDNVVDNTNGTEGTPIRLSATYNTNGDTGNFGNPQVDSGSGAQGFFTASTSTPYIHVSKDGYVSASSDFAASLKLGDSSSAIVYVHFEDQYGNIGTGSFSVNFVTNDPPTITSTLQTSNFNTNLATAGTELAKLEFSDNEGNGIDYTSLTLVNSSAGLGITHNSDTGSITASTNLSAGNYSFTASIKDNTGTERTGSASGSFTIAQAPSGTLDTVNNAYIFSYANTNDPVVTNTHGRNNGIAVQLTATYNDGINFGNPSVVNWFTASTSTDQFNVTSDGYISASSNFTAGRTGTSDTINVHFEDQYGNIGTGSFTVNLVANIAPVTASFSLRTLTHPLTANTTASTFTIEPSPLEPNYNDTPYSASLSGTDAGRLTLTPQNPDSSSYRVTTNSSIASSQTSLKYDINIFDVYGSPSSNYSITQSINPEAALWYAYLVQNGANSLSNAPNIRNELASLLGGSANDNKDLQLAITNENNLTLINNAVIQTQTSDYLIYNLANGEIGNDEIAHQSILTASLVASGSSMPGSPTAPLVPTNLTGIDNAMPNVPPGESGNYSLLLVFPSGSEEQNANFYLPEKMETSANSGNYTNRATLFIDTEGENDFPVASIVFYTSMLNNNTYSGRNKFGVIYAVANNINLLQYYLYPSDSTQPSGTFRKT